MRQLHPVFNIIKLSTAPEDPILGRKLQALPLSIIVNGEEEWEVEEILDSRWYWRRFQFLVKWKGFSREHNSWEATSDVKAPNLVAEYYRITNGHLLFVMGALILQRVQKCEVRQVTKDVVKSEV